MNLYIQCIYFQMQEIDETKGIFQQENLYNSRRFSYRIQKSSSAHEIINIPRVFYACLVICVTIQLQPQIRELTQDMGDSENMSRVISSGCDLRHQVSLRSAPPPPVNHLGLMIWGCLARQRHTTFFTPYIGRRPVLFFILRDPLYQKRCSKIIMI